MDDNAPPPPPPPPEAVPAPPPPAPGYSAPPAPPVIAVAPRSASRGRGWMIFAIILLVLLCVSILSNMGHYASNLVASKGKHIRAVGPKLEEVIVEDNDAANKIALIEIAGIITSRVSDQGGYNLVEIVKAQLKEAEEDSNVKAVILKVDSPGGEVLASDEIYREINDFQRRASKPVVASMGNLAASGGYYVSAPCQWIVANELTITGSIGVIMHSYNYRRLMDKVGLRPEVYKSGKYKDMLSGERDPDNVVPEEREMVQHMIDNTFQKFKHVVYDGRSAAAKKNNGKGQPLAENWDDFADGRVLSGKEAYNLGFVDELGNFQDAVKRACTLSKIHSANLIEYKQHYDFSDLFRLFGKTEDRTLKVDLGIETPKLQVGQLYFIAPTYAH